MIEEQMKEYAIAMLEETDTDQIKRISVTKDSYRNNEMYLEIIIEFKGGESD